MFLVVFYLIGRSYLDIIVLLKLFLLYLGVIYFYFDLFDNICLHNIIL